MLIIQLAFRNATRNWRRTMLTAGMIIAGTFLMIPTMSWIEGVFGNTIQDSTAFIGHVRIADPDFVERESLMPMYENIADVQPVLDEVKQTPGVTGAYAVIQTGGAFTINEELGDYFGAVMGSTPDYYAEQLDLDSKIVEGTFPADGEGVVLGARIARKMGAKVGDELLVIGATQDGAMSPISGKIVAIAHAGMPFIDQGAFFPLDQVQYMLDMDGGAIEVRAYTDDYQDAREIAAAIEANPAFADYAVQAWTKRPPFDQMVGIVGAMQAIISGFLMFIVSLGIWNTMMMSVLERTGEIGVMRAMGLSRMGTISLFVIEAMAIGLIGGILGSALGLIPAWYLSNVGITLGDQLLDQMGGDMAIQATVYGSMSPGLFFKGVAIAVVTGAVGAFIPSIRAAMIQPVTAMQSIKR